MTYKEIYDNFAKDLEKINIRKDYLLPKAVKALRQKRSFPAWVWYDYKIPSTNNQHVIFFYANNIQQVTKPECDFFSVLFEDHQRFAIKWGATRFKTQRGELKAIRNLNFYTSHFIQRFNERLLKDTSLSANDIMCSYLSRNKVVTPIQVDEKVNKNWKEYGDYNNTAFRVTDGISFVTSFAEYKPDCEKNDDNITTILDCYNTYVSKDEMGQEQWNTIRERYVDKWKESLNDLKTETVNGPITLTLEP